VIWRRGAGCETKPHYWNYCLLTFSEIGKDAVYEIADKLLVHKTKLEAALIQREKQLFPSETKLFLYDLIQYLL